MGIGTVRFTLALLVFLGHASGSWLTARAPGDLAVQMFFIISGFYMFLILEKSYTNPLDFYKSRALRIYPLYFIIALFSLFLLPYPNISNATFLTKVHIIFSNLTLFFQDTFLFSGYNSSTGNEYFTPYFKRESYPSHLFILIPASWALGVELMFYVFAPFFAKMKNMTLIKLITLSFGLRFFLYFWGFKNDPWNYRFFPTELALFLIGGIVFRGYNLIKTHPFMNQKIAFYACNGLLLGALLFFKKIPFGYSTAYWFVLGLAILLLPLIFQNSKNKFDAFLGDLSYPIYLSHWLILTLTHRYFPLEQKDMQNAIALIGTLIFSSILIILVQKPIDKYRKKYREPVVKKNT